jgi:steroid 5-alpha reductase family enzyme
MSVPGALATTLGCGVAVMIALWLLSLARRDVSIVDIWWGPGFAWLTAVAFALATAPGSRGTLLLALVSIWGLRLGGYLLWRNWGHGEDARYARMRRHHGERFRWISLASVFGLQAVLQWIVSLPLLFAQLVPGSRPLGVLDAVGVALFATGLFFEAVGDVQLARFKADPQSAGRVMDRGLWRYTRHPNYFGDCLVWWGLFAIAAATPAGPWTIASPLLMTFLLLRVSGVALLERSLVHTRPEYRGYIERTSAFFPRPPSQRTP